VNTHLLPSLFALCAGLTLLLYGGALTFTEARRLRPRPGETWVSLYRPDPREDAVRCHVLACDRQHVLAVWFYGDLYLARRHPIGRFEVLSHQMWRRRVHAHMLRANGLTLPVVARNK
jgi:hypothetical protein